MQQEKKNAQTSQTHVRKKNGQASSGRGERRVGTDVNKPSVKGQNQKRSTERTDESREKSREARNRRNTNRRLGAPRSNVIAFSPRPVSVTGKGTIRVIPLGGLGEIGKNMTVIEYENDLIIIDCGVGFPDEDMPGIDLVIPDTSYLEDNRDRIRALLLTHGHEDHVGAIPYLLRTLNPPIYGTALTLGIVKKKLSETVLPWTPELHEVTAGTQVRLGEVVAEFIHVNHSIADACAIALHTPLGIVVHTGDFKLDVTPIDGEMMDVVRLGNLGQQGVTLLLSESTNAERPGYTPSERKVGASLESIFATHLNKRIIIATFSSNVHRVQQVINVAAKHKRKVAVVGRSMTEIVKVAVELGYMNVPAGVLIEPETVDRYKPEEIAVVTTGSQGEPMSALYRMAYADHGQIALSPSDLVVFSASAIPGNEKLVGNIINELSRMDIEVLHDTSMGVHVSGHACQEELKFMLSLLHPKYFMPVHGEIRHLKAHRDVAKFAGINVRNILLADIGDVVEITAKSARLGGSVPAGKVLVDGNGIGDVGSTVLRDRKHLSEDGLILVVASVDYQSRLLLSGPEIISRGFVYVKEAEEMMARAKTIATKTVNGVLSRGDKTDGVAMRTKIKEDLTSFFYRETGRKPMILPVVMDV